MKKYFTLLFLVFSVSTNAQNWNTIVANDTNYFHITAAGFPDSNFNGRLKCIFNDSTTTNAGFETNHFYLSFRNGVNATLNVLDTMRDTWLGRKCVRDLATGDEIYKNVEGNDILIKTSAGQSASWQFSTDCSGKTYTATVVSIGTMTIDGVLDSFKSIQVQAFLGATPVASRYNTLPITITKEHGFYDVFEFFSFPFDELMSCYNIQPGDLTIKSPLEAMPYNHRRIDEAKKDVNFNKPDLTKIFAAGNTWHATFDDQYGYLKYAHKKVDVINTNFISPDTVITVFLVDNYYHYHIPNLQIPFDSVSQITSLETDTIWNIPTAPFNTIKEFTPEHYPDINTSNYYNVDTNLNQTVYKRNTNIEEIRIFDLCNGERFGVEIHGQDAVSNNVSLHYIGTSTYLQDFPIQFKNYLEQFMPPSLNENRKSECVYFHLGNCYYGTPLSIENDIEKNNLANAIIIFPNPTSDIINIKLNNEFLKVNDIQLFDLQGKKINLISVLEHKKYDISNLSSGIYFLNIKTNKGTLQKKITKY